MTCIIHGLTQELDSVVWKRGSEDITSLSNVYSNYVFSEGSLEQNTQTTTLTVIDAGHTNTDYVCVVTSNEHRKINIKTIVKLEIFSEYFILYSTFSILTFSYNSKFYILILSIT